MSYLSLAFGGFVFLLMVLFYFAQKKSLGWVVLLAGSIVFYCSFDLKYLMFLGFATLSTYGCALCLQKVNHKKLLTALCIILQENDAYHALQKVGGLIFTGPTGTNVNDIAVALIKI